MNGCLTYVNGNHIPRPRYVYSTKFGWVDFHHVFKIMEWCINSVAPGPMYNWQLDQIAHDVEGKGYGGEVIQWLKDNESAFSYEDLCSNHVGAMLFVNNYNQLMQGQITFESMLLHTCIELGFVSPSQAPNYNYIPHIVDDMVPHVYSSTSCLIGESLKNAHKTAFCNKSLQTQYNIRQAHYEFPD